MKNMFFMMAASILMFSCSNENENGILPDNPEKGVVFEIATVNEPQSGLIPRNRPLYGQDALQEVERVNIYVFKQDQSDYLYLKTYNVPGWPKGSTFQRFTVPDNDKLLAGEYQFLIVGQELTDNFTLTTPVVDQTKITDMTASITAPGQESEIFAGNKNVTVSSEGVRVSVDMTRQVSGVLGYFKNVPYRLNNQTVKYLRLSVTNTDNQVLLSNGGGNTPTNAAYNIINVDLSSQTVTSDSVYAGNDLTAQGVVKVPNSQLFGKFLLPVNDISMTLGLYAADGTALKTWSVQDGNSTQFSLIANNFYALGRKVSQSNTTGGTTDPGDDDAPVDLLKDQVIVITIDPNWNTLHNLTIQ